MTNYSFMYSYLFSMYSMYVVCMACAIMSPQRVRFLLPPETLHYFTIVIVQSAASRYILYVYIPPPPLLPTTNLWYLLAWFDLPTADPSVPGVILLPYRCPRVPRILPEYTPEYIF